MDNSLPSHGLELRSLILASGELQISLLDVPLKTPLEDEVVVRIDASPINPSDIGLLFGSADMSTANLVGSGAQTVLTAKVPDGAMAGMMGRLNQSMPVGNEGSGKVVSAGSSGKAQALVGKTVAVLGGAMYSQYRTLNLSQCLVLPSGTKAEQGASCFVNPLTALGMVETMRIEGHKALVHTAAASNLGQMLLKICIKDGISLVNIVRKPEQVELLKSLGAKYVCDTSSTTFMDDLTKALIETGATLAFDATGGGHLSGQILTCMEASLSRDRKVYSRYGSSTHKQVYLYGGLDTRPTQFQRSFGMSWGIGGWLLFLFIQKIGSQKLEAMKLRVASELTTTFASHYAAEIGLSEVLKPEMVSKYGIRATSAKYWINPQKI